MNIDFIYCDFRLNVKKSHFNAMLLLFFFYSDVRWKNKFWGKSMEILPIGSVNLMIPR